MRAVGIDAFQRRHIGGERQFPEFLGLIDDDLVDSDFRNRQQIVLARRKRCEPLPQSLLQSLEPLAGNPVVALDLAQQVLVEILLVLDHLLFEGAGHVDEAESRMGDNDRIPGRGRRARQEAMPLVFSEIRFVGHENARARIEGQKLAGCLRKAMAGDDEHRLGDQAESTLLHDCGGHGHRLSGADGMCKIGGTGGDDPPDAAFLMRVEGERAARARQFQMRAVEGARRDIVESVVVDASQPIGSIGVGPDPGLESGLDLLQLLLGRLRIDDVEDAALARAFPDRVEYLGDAAVESVGQEFAGVPALGPPIRCARSHPGELARFDGP